MGFLDWLTNIKKFNIYLIGLFSISIYTEKN
jgi:hypothetical protein